MHEQSKPQEAERDFKKLNKMSIKNGIIDAKNQKDFREKNDARIEQTIGDRSRRGRGLGVPENLAFGKANRPSTPINGIICNYYGETASHEIEEKYALSIELVSYTSLTVIYETEEANQGPSKAKGNQSPREGS
jgi:hypothetical protein